MSYHINEIDEDGCVTVLFAVDGVGHRIAKLPIDDAAALHSALVDWEAAYETGLALTAVPATPKDVQAMIGQDIATAPSADIVTIGGKVLVADVFEAAP